MIAKRLKEFRKAVGLTQRQVAKMCAIGKRTLIYWEMGERELRCSKLIPLQREYDLNFNWLITGQGEMFLDQAEQVPTISLSDPELDEELDQEAHITSMEETPSEPEPTPEPDPLAGDTDPKVLPLIERLRRK